MAVFERILCVLTLQLNSVIGNFTRTRLLCLPIPRKILLWPLKQTPVSPVLNLQSAVATLLATEGDLGGILPFATSSSTKRTILRNEFCDTKIIFSFLSTMLPLRRVSNQNWFLCYP